MNPLKESGSHLSQAQELGLLSGIDFEELDRLTALAAEVCDAEFAAFTVHDADIAYQVSTSFGVRELIPNAECVCSVVMRPGASVLIADARADETVAHYRHVVQDLFIRSFAGVSVGVEADEVIGVLAVGHSRPGVFGTRDAERLSRIGELVRAFLASRRDAFRAQRAARLTEIAQKAAERGLSERNAQLADALSEAEHANRAKSDFMGVVSHELRTPMNAVLGCATLLSKSQLDAGQKRTLGVLQDAGRQMQVLLDDLIDLSSLEADKIKIHPSPASMRRLLEDAAAIWSSEIRAKGLGLSVLIDPHLGAPREFDDGRLLQIVGNLMSNAIKFTQAGDISIRAMATGLDHRGERVTIEIEDSGVGVPQDAVERIFSPFEQADVSAKRAHGGLGLGLYVARRLAEAMGGGIALSSEPGEGSRFTVMLLAPLASVTALNDKAPAIEESPARRVFCIDDNPRNLFVVPALLVAAGHEPFESLSGQEALERLDQEKFDVILLDMVMPGMDGIAVLSQLRHGSGPNAATPVIACTANVLPDQVEAYLAAGCCAVVAKPIDLRTMLEAIAAAA